MIRLRFARFFTSWLALCIAAALAAFPGTATAQSAAESVLPVVEREHYEQLCGRLRLERNDRLVPDATFAQYSDDLKSVMDEAQRAAEEAGLQRVRDVVSGRGTATPEQLRQWELAVLEAFALAWPQADRLFDDLLRDLEMLVVGSAAGEYPAAARALRRAVLLHPRQERGRHDQSYLGDGVDLVQLLEQASASGAIPPLGGPGEAPGQLPAGGELPALLTSYEVQLDALLRQTWAAERMSRLLRARADVTGKEQDLAMIESESVDRWQRLFNLNRQFADQIGVALATASGPPGVVARQSWLQLVGEATAPWLYEQESSDAAWAWMERNLAGENLAAAGKIYSSFQTIRLIARQSAVDAMVTARTQARAMLRPQTSASSTTGGGVGARAANPRLQQALDAKFYELIALEASTREKLIALLTDAERQEMQKELDQRRPRAPRR